MRSTLVTPAVVDDLDQDRDVAASAEAARSPGRAWPSDARFRVDVHDDEHMRIEQFLHRLGVLLLGGFSELLYFLGRQADGRASRVLARGA